MLSDGKPIKYWDACVPLSYINGIPDRLPDIEGLMQKSGIEFYIITSEKLWQLGSPIQLVEFYELIASKAKGLMPAALTKGWKMTPGDLAVASQRRNVHKSFGEGCSTCVSR